MSLSMKTWLIGLSGGTAAAACAGAVGFAVAACDTLDDKTPLLDRDNNKNISIFDAGDFVPPQEQPPPENPDPGTGNGGGDGGPPAPGRLRLAHFVIGAGAVNFCYQLEGQETWSPVQGGSSGLTYGQVSAPLSLQVPEAGGTYALRIIAAGSSCTPPPAGDGGEEAAGPLAETEVDVAPGEGTTVLVYGTQDGSALVAEPLKDDAPDPAGVTLRAFHGSDDTAPVDIRVGATSLARSVPYGGVVSGAVPGSVSAGTLLTLNIGTTARSFNLPALNSGSARTAYVTGRSGAGKTPPLTVQLCDDSPTGTTGSLSNCQPLVASP